MAGQKFSVLAAALVAAGWGVGGSVAHADVLSGNFWPNPTLENASTSRPNSPSLSNTVGGAGTWRRGGGDYADPPNDTGPYTYDFWDNSHGAVSGTHALVLNDNSTTGNGEWFVPDFDTDSSFVPVTGGVPVEFRFFWNYNVSIAATNGNGADMRVTIRGTDGTSSFGLYDFTTPQTDPNDPLNKTTGGQFVVADFIRTLPVGTTGIRMNIASGGDAGVTGFLAVDDITVRYVPEPTSMVAVLGLGGTLLRRRRA